MSTVNPYMPPRAAVADIEDADAEFQDVKMWSARGRIGRLRYLAYLMGAYLVFAFGFGVLSAIAGAAGAPDLALAGILLLGLPYAVFIAFVSIQRSHDMGWSGWTFLLAFIPLAGLIWLFNGGTPGPNRYGAPPPPNTTGVKILASVIPVIMVIGILAAIAIPAYSDYQKRAQAAQAR